MQGDGHRLGQCRDPGWEGVRYSDKAVSCSRLVLTKGPAVASEVRRRAVEADRRAAPPTRSARAAPRSRVAHDPVTGGPDGVTGRRRHDAGPFVAEDRTWLGVLLKDHVQIGAADTAFRNLDENVTRARLRTWHLGDGDSAVAHIDGGRHGRRWHAGNHRDFRSPGAHGGNSSELAPVGVAVSSAAACFRPRAPMKTKEGDDRR